MPRPPRVVHLSTSGSGGAGGAAANLHHALVAAGVHGTFITDTGERGPARGGAGREVAHGGKRLMRVLSERMLSAGRDAAAETFSFPWGLLAPFPRLPSPAPDCVVVHWVDSWWSWADFPAHVPPEMPVVLYLHDLANFTGGCHYADGCTRFESRCTDCPQCPPRAGVDVADMAWAQKQRAWGGRRLHVLADSHWLLATAQRAALLAHARSFDVLPYGVDTVAFAPVDQAAARDMLRIPRDAHVVAMGAHALGNRRKGASTFLAAMQDMPPDTWVLTFGQGQLEVPGHPAVHAGAIHHPGLLSAVYSAADVVAVPSLEEAFGLTATEAMACGTPVVASNTGGLPDQVLDGKTGLLVPPADPRALCEAMTRLLRDPGLRRQLGTQGRANVMEHFSLAGAARTFLDIAQKRGFLGTPGAGAGA